MKSIFGYALILVGGLATASESVKSMPAEFQGEWNAVLADCGTGNNDSRLRIAANRISYWESDGPIKAIVVHDGRREVTLIAELTGEGETRIATAQFKLSPKKDMLMDASASPDEFVRYRCPPSR